MTLMMMQMRVEVEDRARDRREKAEDQWEMAKDRKQLSEVMIGITSEYFASRGVEGGRRAKSDVNAKNRQWALI